MDKQELRKIALEDHPLPLRFIFDVNWNCNLKCRMCVKRTIKKPYGQRPIEDIIKMMDKVPWAREIQIGALGDPFCYKGIENVIDLLVAKKVSCPFTSNATLFTEDNIKIFPPNSVLYISVDGGTEETYFNVRRSSLEKVKRNIIMLRQRRPDIRVQINHLIFKNNILEAKKMVDFCAQVKCGITFAYPIFFTEKLENELSAMYLGKEMVSQLTELSHYAFMRKVPHVMPSFHMRQTLCQRGLYSQPIIAFDGTVYPCDYCYQDMNNLKKPEWTSWYLGKPVRVPQHQYMMGNIYKDNFMEMWNSDKWKKLRRINYEFMEKPITKPYDELLKEVDLDKEFEHCKVCLSRWSRCF